jgi:predicted aspartyl protease
MSVSGKATLIGDNLLRLISTATVCFPEAMLPKKSPPCNMIAKAIWDTGATNTVISSRVARKLRLQNVGYQDVCHAGGISTVPVYYITLCIHGEVRKFSLRATEGNIAGADVLIGVDIISHGDFHVDSCSGITLFSFTARK